MRVHNDTPIESGPARTFFTEDGISSISKQAETVQLSSLAVAHLNCVTITRISMMHRIHWPRMTAESELADITFSQPSTLPALIDPRHNHLPAAAPQTSRSCDSNALHLEIVVAEDTPGVLQQTYPRDD
ncbi:uncharacterized protein EI90DRAFT_3083036 [Cantharellus anzutake]|uniref:uncharacterized protein n=1 Tax=Cantharellus anzutake TaxID=1750568 RepID=UPI0019038E9C|nr:uncharacterized protein EI90DRAFT_3083036 [Cantharellus anzutake]KAF8318588.1 hypothetical protein EI90DRAFT_3083036 [Cantharellus anzutake]